MILGLRRFEVVFKQLRISNYHYCDHRTGQNLIRTMSTVISEPLEKQEKIEYCITNKEIKSRFGDNMDELSDELEADYLRLKDREDNKWLNYDKRCYVYLFRGGGLPKDTIAAFDLDHTIIKPKGSSRIPKSSTDWEFFSVWTKQKIEQVVRESNSRFIIFTNQYGVGLQKVTLAEVQERVELVTKRINIPCTVFMATEMDEFRKPGTRMYELFTRAFNDNIIIDRHRSFYCGDAVGYKSHSDADIKFAQSLDLPFLTPDKFVRGCHPKIVT